MPDPFEQRFPGGSASANAAVRALVETYDVITRFANSAMDDYDLSPAARQALATIDGAGGSLAQTEIAERLLTTPPSISSLVDTLERRGLVERRRDPDDRRRQLVHLTREGTAIVRRFVPEAVALQTAVMADVSEGDRARLLRLLQTIRDTTAALDGAEVVSEVRRRGERRRP